MTKYYSKGAVVMAIAGREKNKIFIVTHRDGDYVYLINGKTRPLESPKKKNIKHLQLLCRADIANIDIDNLTNAHTIKYLKDYKKSRDYK